MILPKRLPNQKIIINIKQKVFIKKRLTNQKD